MTKRLDHLIAHHKRRQSECEIERDRSHLMPTDADQARVYSTWEEERQIARDTVSFLETLKARWAP